MLSYNISTAHEKKVYMSFKCCINFIELTLFKVMHIWILMHFQTAIFQRIRFCSFSSYAKKKEQKKRNFLKNAKTQTQPYREYEVSRLQLRTCFSIQFRELRRYKWKYISCVFWAGIVVRSVFVSYFSLYFLFIHNKSRADSLKGCQIL